MLRPDLNEVVVDGVDVVVDGVGVIVDGGDVCMSLILTEHYNNHCDCVYYCECVTTDLSQQPVG
uniref:Uncharacterized protein n=1 Tax=Arion vulgaris TaxID=1028688 RepID=A0A0B6XY39_9EUPU